jgi:hypothetical protein
MPYAFDYGAAATFEMPHDIAGELGIRDRDRKTVPYTALPGYIATLWAMAVAEAGSRKGDKLQGYVTYLKAQLTGYTVGGGAGGGSDRASPGGYTTPGGTTTSRPEVPLDVIEDLAVEESGVSAGTVIVGVGMVAATVAAIAAAVKYWGKN